MGESGTHPDLVAFHHDSRTARATIVRLSRAGVDGGAIALQGPVEVVTAGRYGDRQTDRGSSLALGAAFLRGAAWGLVPGAVFGAVLLVVAAGANLEALLLGSLGGASFGAAVGALAGLLHAPTMVTSWERTFAPLVPGPVVVGVRCADERAMTRALRVLRVSGAYAIRLVGDLDTLPDGPLDPDEIGFPPPPIVGG